MILNIKKHAYLYALVLFVVSFGVYERYDLSKKLYSECGPWSDCASSEMNINNISNWKTYRNEEYGFEIKYPNSWFYKKVSDQGLILIQSTSFENNLHGSGVPPMGNMWLSIVPRYKCETEGYVAYSYPDTLSKSVCFNNIGLVIELWQADPDIENHKKILDQIVSTFKFTN